MAKTQLEMKLYRNAGDSKLSFFKYINSKRQCKNNITSLQDEDGHLTNRDMNKADVCYTFFASVFSMDDRQSGSQCPVRMTKPSWHICLGASWIWLCWTWRKFLVVLTEAILVALLY